MPKRSLKISGKRLGELRARLYWTQRQLAEALDMGEGNVARLERETAAGIYRNAIPLLADAMKSRGVEPSSAAAVESFLAATEPEIAEAAAGKEQAKKKPWFVLKKQDDPETYEAIERVAKQRGVGLNEAAQQMLWERIKELDAAAKKKDHPPVRVERFNERRQRGGKPARTGGQAK